MLLEDSYPKHSINMGNKCVYHELHAVSCIFCWKITFFLQTVFQQIVQELSHLTDWGQDIAASPVISLGTVLQATGTGRGSMLIIAPVMGPFR